MNAPTLCWPQSEAFNAVGFSTARTEGPLGPLLGRDQEEVGDHFFRLLNGHCSGVPGLGTKKDRRDWEFGLAGNGL